MLIPPGHMVFLGCRSGRNCPRFSSFSPPPPLTWLPLINCSAIALGHRFCPCYWYFQNNQSQSYPREVWCAQSQLLPVLSWVVLYNIFNLSEHLFLLLLITQNNNNVCCLRAYYVKSTLLVIIINTISLYSPCEIRVLSLFYKGEKQAHSS